jgi:hypothetical protein
MAIYDWNMLWININVAVTIVCCTVTEIYIDEITVCFKGKNQAYECKQTCF